MAFKHKYSYEEKEHILMEYLNGTHGFRELCRIYGMSQGALKGWIRLYNAFGWEGLVTGSKARRYSSETKQAAVEDYLSGHLSGPEVLKKYKIRSETQLRRWIMKYNGHEELKSSGTGGCTIMTKGRKTTFDERVEIVQYCITHGRNYTETSEKYGISYQQARNYTVKYESGGVDALKDRRGKRKALEEMSELERLRAEVKLLRAEKKRAEDEIEKIHEDSPDKGYRRIRDELERYHGMKANDKRVLRICRKLGIKSTIKYANNECTRHAKNPQYIAENVLDRQFNAQAPNEKWLTDMTEFHYYVGLEKHRVYLSAILDLYDRRIVAYVIGDSNNNAFSIVTGASNIRTGHFMQGWRQQG